MRARPACSDRFSPAKPTSFCSTSSSTWRNMRLRLRPCSRPPAPCCSSRTGEGDIVMRVARALPRLLPRCSSVDLQDPLLELCLVVRQPRAHTSLLTPSLHYHSCCAPPPPRHRRAALVHANRSLSLATQELGDGVSTAAFNCVPPARTSIPPMSSGASRPSRPSQAGGFGQRALQSGERVHGGLVDYACELHRRGLT